MARATAAAAGDAATAHGLSSCVRVCAEHRQPLCYGLTALLHRLQHPAVRLHSLHRSAHQPPVIFSVQLCGDRLMNAMATAVCAVTVHCLCAVIGAAVHVWATTDKGVEAVVIATGVAAHKAAAVA